MNMDPIKYEQNLLMQSTVNAKEIIVRDPTPKLFGADQISKAETKIDLMPDTLVSYQPLIPEKQVKEASFLDQLYDYFFPSEKSELATANQSDVEIETKPILPSLDQKNKISQQYADENRIAQERQEELEKIAEQIKADRAREKLTEQDHELIKYVDEINTLTKGTVFSKYIQAICEQGKIRDHIIELNVDRNKFLQEVCQGINDKLVDLDEKILTNKDTDRYLGYMHTALNLSLAAFTIYGVGTAIAATGGTGAPLFARLATWALKPTTMYIKSCLLIGTGANKVVQAKVDYTTTKHQRDQLEATEKMQQQQTEMKTNLKHVQEAVETVKSHTSLMRELIEKIKDMKTYRS